MVNTGWPETVKEVTDNLKQYWSFRSETVPKDHMLCVRTYQFVLGTIFMYS